MMWFAARSDAGMWFAAFMRQTITQLLGYTYQISTILVEGRDA